MGVRKSSDLEEDLSKLTLPKFIILFIILNAVFILFIILAINLIWISSLNSALI
jgi:hypothetical protein